MGDAQLSLAGRPSGQASFQRLAHEGVLKILTKKVIQASDAEIAANPRARSVKMRVAEKMGPVPPGTRKQRLIPTSTGSRKRKSGSNERVFHRKAD